MPRVPFSLLLTLGLVAMLTPLAIDMYLPSLPRIARDLGVAPGAVQGTVSAYVAGFALGQLALGPLADSLGRRPVLLWGTLVFTLLCPLCALSTDIGFLQWLRIGQGGAGAAASVVIYALLRDLVSDRNELARLFSTITLVVTLAPLLAPMLGGWVLLLADWHAIFWVLGAFGAAACLLVAAKVPETLPAKAPLALGTVLGNYRTLLAKPALLGLMFCSGLSFSGLMAFLTAGSFVYIDQFGVPEGHFGYYFGLNVLSLMALTFVNGRLVGRKGAERLLAFALGLQCLAALVALATAWWNGPFWLLVVAVMTYVGCLSMVGSNIMALVLEQLPALAGTAASLTGSLRFGIGAGVGALMAAAQGHDALAMTGTMTASVLLACFSFWGLYRRFR
ncbi:Bcr/CflA family multidrug efflux MFS transporter [Gallaecimonas kandeliae]|uniref:Bcr/CflA family multidrug efflux MFS transporter n=1 Tax=Gallaecimonas kandeliae TaxID=3029055 RepID=UPI00264A0FB8|nr:Bcr/CflA family multidrug efflux MFS transporter [Gallaecimonas kandeliae]WKE67172.1 Bcr/CflA family multidrug efflux MFS transporter [Gallaecimonas kandeliae]